MTGSERFQSGASKYAAYLETPEGRLRSDLAFANLQDLLPVMGNPSLRALDLGCGTGAIGIRLARLGAHVTLLDSSREMLDIAQGAVREAGLTDRVVVQQRDADQLANSIDPASFDVIVCHNVLEFLADPVAAFCSMARALRNSSAIVSVLVRNRAGEVFKAAVLNGDLAVAEKTVAAEWGEESLYGGKVRLFTPASLRLMLNEASLVSIAERGVRVFADYLPPRLSRTDEYERIFALERTVGCLPDYAAVARYTQFVAQLP